VIARVWQGRVRAEVAGEYARLMREVALPKYREITGNIGAWCLHRIVDDVAHFEMLTFWTGVDAIKRFAGEDYECAKYYDFDPQFLLELSPRVVHYEAHDQ
jgi:hypothetical protein